MVQPLVIDSPFFTHDFNTAIIDGPLRIYFSSRQEDDALEIYYNIKEFLVGSGKKLKDLPVDEENTFVMLYQSAEAFEAIFKSSEVLKWDRWGTHHILGLNISKIEKRGDILDKINQKIDFVFSKLELLPAAP